MAIDPVREDEKREAEARLEALLLQGLESGDPTPMTKQDWEDIKKRGLARMQKSNNAKDGIETLEGIRRGLESMKAGKGKPFEEVFADFSKTYGIDVEE